jgi:hypothetical protein
MGYSSSNIAPISGLDGFAAATWVARSVSSLIIAPMAYNKEGSSLEYIAGGAMLNE